MGLSGARRRGDDEIGDGVFEGRLVGRSIPFRQERGDGVVDNECGGREAEGGGMTATLGDQ
jgi:hypothetical protein